MMSRVSLGLLTLGLFIGCAKKSITNEIKTSDFLLTKDTQQITFMGDNSHPRFSPDSRKIIYSSRLRAAHSNSQIYELDFINNKERRITFSDGDAFDPSFIDTHEIIYASTTDEIKENPLINKNFDPATPPADLYTSDMFGTQILRLTHNPGYDGEPWFVKPSKDSPMIYFSSRRGPLFGIYRLDTQKKLQISMVSAEKEKIKRSPTVYLRKNLLAWIERNPKTEKESLIIYDLKTKIPRRIKDSEGLYRDLFFAPQEPARLFYSIVRKGERHAQIEVLNLENSCTQVVFKGNDSLEGPAVSTGTPEKIVFTRLIADKRQIYQATLPTELGPCISSSTQDTLKE